jgi:hypothetical protein
VTRNAPRQAAKVTRRGGIAKVSVESGDAIQPRSLGNPVGHAGCLGVGWTGGPPP